MKKYSSVAEYFDDHSGIHLEIMHKIRDIILEEAPEAQPAISYGMPSYKTDVVIAGVYAYKNHVSFYPHTGELTEKYREELADYKLGKGTIQIGIKQDIPEATIRKIVKDRLAMA